MLPKGCAVRGYRDVFTPAAVRAYRHYGFLFVEHFLSAEPLQQLTTLCNATARRRGENVFPGIDPQHRHGASSPLKASLQPKATPQADPDSDAATPSASSSSPSDLSFGDGPLPAEAVQVAEETDRTKSFETHTRKVRLTLRNKRAVDRAFSRLTKRRDRYNAYKRIHQYVSREEELSGEMTDARIREVREKYTYDDLKRGFQEYRDSGMLEREIRHEHHVNDVMRFMQNWPRTWCWLGRSSPELQQLALTTHGAVGRAVGEAAGQLSGEVLLRVYSDSAVQDAPLTNAVPLGFAGAGTNFAHPQALCVQLGLASNTVPSNTPPPGASQVLMPGSHHVVRRISQDGKEMDRFLSGGIFDMGSIVRGVPEVAHLPMVELPPLPPGSALFFNNYLLMGMQPTLTGPAQQAVHTVAETPFMQLANYALSLIPDRCVFDGQRNSWASRDTHGPLYAYKRGDLLTDDAVFPVIHRALDIE